MSRSHVLGADVTTDDIIPGRHGHLGTAEELAPFVFENVDPSLRSELAQGDVVFAGANFGCGSAREKAPLAMKGAGIGGVVASSFARIFLRNAVNVGLPALVSPEAVAAVRAGDEVQVDFRSGRITLADGRCIDAIPLPPHLQEIVRAGGLVNWTRARLGEKEKGRRTDDAGN